MVPGFDVGCGGTRFCRGGAFVGRGRAGTGVVRFVAYVAASLFSVSAVWSGSSRRTRVFRTEKQRGDPQVREDGTFARCVSFMVSAVGFCAIVAWRGTILFTWWCGAGVSEDAADFRVG